jgi:ABC-type multidrug transport system fused ATPase/permease subunit
MAAAEQILDLDQGRLVERGSHAKLLAKGALYANLCQHQT